MHLGPVADGKALPDLGRRAAAVGEEFADLYALVTGTDRAPVS
ncbi:hypothetical protein [Streptomyces californicus]